MNSTDELNIVIEDDVQQPEVRVNFKQYLDKLKVGQSFRVDAEHKDQLRNAVSNAQRRSPPKKFMVRKVKEPVNSRKVVGSISDGRRTRGKVEEFARVWRLKDDK